MMKKVVGRNVVIVLGIICIFLSVSLVRAIANYTSIISVKDNTISSLNSQLSSKDSQIQTLTSHTGQLQTWLNGNVTSLNTQIAILQSQVSSDNATIANLQSQLESANSQIGDLQNQIVTLQNQVNDLTAIINMSKSELKTLVFHVCEKGEGYEWGHVPDVNYTYNQILTFNNSTYEILLFPEYRGNENWTETTAWLTENFAQIPIMLPVFEGGIYDYPVVKLTADQILEAVGTCNVKWLRFAEVISWHIEHNVTFPTAYVTEILNFCRAHGLKLFWTEWKADAFKAVQTYIAGFEDIVTVSFSTNSEDLEPADGFLLINSMFQHWGTSVQSWYWKTRSYGSELDMPTSLLVQHALAAKNIGAEIIQFEPYWYFFDNGEAKENLKPLEIMLT